jgi:hypothetical protein
MHTLTNYSALRLEAVRSSDISPSSVRLHGVTTQRAASIYIYDWNPANAIENDMGFIAMWERERAAAG